MPAPQPVRGTRDLLDEDQRRHRHVTEAARRITALYGCAEWSTPIFEDTSVFARTLGETSDVVSKEMYSFTDRGGDSITLRPEGTAGICRALVSNGLTQSLPQKIFYAGPMFRYERPQKGRYRQFHQIGMELIGPAEPMADAEAIACARDILTTLGIAGTITLQINTLGDADSRAGYRAALVTYFDRHRAELSADSQVRLAKNPLRIQDSKDAADRAVVADAPTIAAFLTPAAARFYEGLRAALQSFGVVFVENPRIVRGLDYYNHTAFEFVTDALGAQGTVLAGGRYDGLVAEMGGPAVPAVGWAAGIDRLALLLQAAPGQVAPVAVIATEGSPQDHAVTVLQSLRAAGIRAEMSYAGSVKKQMQRADRIGARFAVLVGGGGQNSRTAQLRDMTDGSQTEVGLGDLPARLLV